MRYCRFLFENQTHYGAVEDREGEPWIVRLIEAPEEDLAFRLEHGSATSSTFDFEPIPLSAAELLPPGIAGLRQDVDTPDDLRAAARLGLGPRTAALAAELLRAAG